MSDNILTVEIGCCQIYLRAHLDPTHHPNPPQPTPAHAGRLTVSASVLPCRLGGFPWRRLG